VGKICTTHCLLCVRRIAFLSFVCLSLLICTSVLLFSSLIIFVLLISLLFN
jgi:hypothetical protein